MFIDDGETALGCGSFTTKTNHTILHKFIAYPPLKTHSFLLKTEYS